mmetsp:Transcript_29502/g.5334  ORF Transcript_29502/g.5334 Transcript_29502/m.5334 type:complete len:88 (-) Transcript_29502:1744-2007(-)
MSTEFRGNQVVDLSNENLSMMINILIAQAYYCLYNKIDKNTPNKANLVKLANTIANYYSFAHETLVRDPLKRHYSRDYAESIRSKEL